MKRLFLVLFLLAVIAASAYAVINTPVITALNTSTFVAITIPQTNGHCRWVSAHTEDSTSFIIAVDSSGTGAETIPASTAYKNPCVTDSVGVVFYAKATAGTPNLAINYGVNP